jgi:hypothetical protein
MFKYYFSQKFKNMFKDENVIYGIWPLHTIYKYWIIT